MSPQVSNQPPLLRVRDLSVSFQTPRGAIQALDSVDLDLDSGEVLALIGESGSGKSVALRSLLRLLPEKRTSVSGSIRFENRDVLGLSKPELGRYRGGEVAMVFQEPMLAFDPVFSIGHQIAEAVVRHKGVTWARARARALELLDLVRIPSAKARLDEFPHRLSGGMRQRAMIALALSCSPKILLADEPTTALDATVQIQIILLLRALQRDLGMAVIFVTHDVGVAAEIADHVAVMYAGRIVESGSASEVLKRPGHPYAAGLLASTIHGARRGDPLHTVTGMPPDLANMPKGCAFAPRCPNVETKCGAAKPELRRSGESRSVACIAPLVSLP